MGERGVHEVLQDRQEPVLEGVGGVPVGTWHLSQEPARQAELARQRGAKPPGRVLSTDRNIYKSHISVWPCLPIGAFSCLLSLLSLEVFSFSS